MSSGRWESKEGAGRGWEERSDLRPTFSQRGWLWDRSPFLAPGFLFKCVLSFSCHCEMSCLFGVYLFISF